MGCCKRSKEGSCEMRIHKGICTFLLFQLLLGCSETSTEPSGSATRETPIAQNTHEKPTSQSSSSITTKSTPTPSMPTNHDIKSLVPSGWHILVARDKPTSAEGDLNNDSIPDIATVIEKNETTQDGNAPPRSLLIAFGIGNGEYTLSIIADNAVLRANEGGTFGDPFDGIVIDRGSVVLSDLGGSRWKWSDKYRFRFQNNDWYLIGQTQTDHDGLTASSVEDDYNLLTGDFIVNKAENGSATPVITKGNRGLKSVLLREFKADTSHNLLDSTPILNEITSHVNDLYAPIINAYAALELSGYTSFNKDLIGDSLLAVEKGSTYNFGWDTKPILMYTYYDINSDGSSELLIGADKSISGIYTLQDGKPMSISQVESRHNLRLLKGIDGNSVLEDSFGHMGYATEFFYKIDKDGKLVTLDKLFTNGDDKKGDKFIGHFRAKDVLGKEVSITEEEYCSLIRKYGSTGYEPLEDVGKERPIDVTWKPVANEK